MNQTEIKERKYLSEILGKIREMLRKTTKAVEEHVKNIQENKNYLYDNKDGMDHAEKINVRQSIDNIGLVGENAADKKRRLSKLLEVPYFGRIDFKKKGEKKHQPIYVGIHTFLDEAQNKNLIHDWRAPLSSMFYDFELGDAHYESPSGKTEGEISLKRQFRIRRGEMEYMLESALNIHDEVLQQELNQASSDKMKNIVATIQREQNAIIRNEKAATLIIQGVAGSGKTSIALHRIAFLLYKFKDEISSEDILIISPNKVFASYISNVLPELGEEKVNEISLEALADEILMEKYKFQSFFEQVAKLLDKKDKEFEARIQFKSGADFSKKIDQYLLYLENEGFKATDLFVKRYPVPAWFIEERFQAHSYDPLLVRHNKVVGDIVVNVFKYYKHEVSSAERTEIREAVKKMLPSHNLRVLYKGLYDWMERPEMLKYIKGSQLEYADVYPFIYLKMRLEGNKPYAKVKHLVIDEMQDYSPIQYKVLNRMFSCNKTILGDINQSVNPLSSSNLELIQEIMPDSECMSMNKSYRSTYEITNFTKRINPQLDVEPIERYGEEPKIICVKKKTEELGQIKETLVAFEKTTYNSFGIICKTKKQAEQVKNYLNDGGISFNYFDENSMVFSNGVVLTTAHLAKGLEFDQVHVPFCDAANYQSAADRQMLYVACTRAMHLLVLTHTGKLTELIQ